MYCFWSGLLGAIALLWSVLGLRMLRGMAGVPRLAGVMPLPDGECPKISILFAARDEVAKLPQALPTQLAQDYPRYVLILHANGSHAGRVSPFYALTHPLGAAIFCYIMLRSTIVTLWHRGVVWRDTFYPLDELRKGVV